MKSHSSNIVYQMKGEGQDHSSISKDNVERKTSIKRESKKSRVQFDMNEESIAKLDKLGKRLHTSSRAYVVRKSLAFFGWILDKVEEGYDIYLIKDKEREKIVIPDLKD